MNRDDIWEWASGIFGAAVIGLVIAAFVTDFAGGDPEKIIGLVGLLIFAGFVPLLGAADDLGGWSINGGDDE